MPSVTGSWPCRAPRWMSPVAVLLGVLGRTSVVSQLVWLGEAKPRKPWDGRLACAKHDFQGVRLRKLFRYPIRCEGCGKADCELVGSTRCTQGIWLWSTPFVFPDKEPLVGKSVEFQTALLCAFHCNCKEGDLPQWATCCIQHEDGRKIAVLLMDTQGKVGNGT